MDHANYQKCLFFLGGGGFSMEMRTSIASTFEINCRDWGRTPTVALNINKDCDVLDGSHMCMYIESESDSKICTKSFK